MNSNPLRKMRLGNLLDCCNLFPAYTYIGLCKSHLKVKMCENFGVSAFTDKISSSSAPLTAVYEHMLECDHRVVMILVFLFTLTILFLTLTQIISFTR